MTDFLETMNIESLSIKIGDINDSNIINIIKDNDVILSSSFTEYMHPLFFLAMELGIPCLIGNNSDLFDNDEIKKYVVTSAEDNAIVNAQMISNILKNKVVIIVAAVVLVVIVGCVVVIVMKRRK